jgi:hypothetical protein
MPQPVLSDLYYSQIQQDVSVMNLQKPDDFIADKVLPRLMVDKSKGIYYIYDDAYFHTAGARKRLPGTKSNTVGFTASRASFSIDEWALNSIIPEEDYEEADSVFDLDADHTTMLTQNMKVSMEAEFISNVMAAGKWTTTLYGEVHGGGGGASYFDYWSDTTNGAPITDIRSAKNTIVKATGQRPNKLVLAPEVYDALCEHPDILARYTPTTSKTVDQTDLARLFGVDEVLVPYAIANTAAEGQTYTPNYMHSKYALLLYVTDAPGKRVPTGGYTITKRQQGAQPVTVRKGREEFLKRANIIEVASSWSFKIVAPAMGVFFSGAVA